MLEGECPSPSAVSRNPDIGATACGAAGAPETFPAKRKQRVWRKREVRRVEEFADPRLRYTGRFVKKEDEELMRAAMEIC